MDGEQMTGRVFPNERRWSGLARGFLACATALLLVLVSRGSEAQAPSSGAAGAPAKSASAIRGFSSARAAAERELERNLLRIPSPESAERNLRILTSAPHMAGADVVPFDYEAYAAEISRSLEELDAAMKLGGESKLDLARLREAAAAFKTSATHARQALEALGGAAPDAARAAVFNRKLVEVEQALLAPQGLAGRPWYRHTIYAPGTYSGYSAVTLPGVREAFYRKDIETARREAAVLEEALRRAASRLEEAARLGFAHAAPRLDNADCLDNAARLGAAVFLGEGTHVGNAARLVTQ